MLPTAQHQDALQDDRSATLLAWGLLGTALVLGGAVRFWLCLHDDGIYWPDEIYQSLEPAHRLAFGYGLVPWEFIDGARNWSFPGLLGGVLKVLAGLGLSEPRRYLIAIRALMALVSLISAVGVYRLARVIGAAPVASALGGALWALAVPGIYFAPRALTETASAAPVVWGFALALDRPGGRWRQVAGASLLGLAVLLRLQNGVFCIAVLAILLGRREWPRLVRVALVLAGWAFFYGLLDRLTWGGWFHSAIVYVRFNLVEGKAANWGTADGFYYLRTLNRVMPVTFWALVILSLVAIRRALGVWLAAAAFLLAHSLIPHKELRFILPDLPLLCALGALGFCQIAGGSWERGRMLSRLIGVGLLLATLGSVSRFHELKFLDVGQYVDSKPDASAYDDFGPVNRLLLAAHDEPGLCGLKIEAAHLAWTGGYSYLHRNVPLYPFNGPPRDSGLFNYVITVPQGAVGGEVRAQQGPLALMKLFDGPCRPDPSYSWRLP